MYQVPIDAEGELGVQSLVGKTETSGEAYLLQPLCVCVCVCVSVCLCVSVCGLLAKT